MSPRLVACLLHKIPTELHMLPDYKSSFKCFGNTVVLLCCKISLLRRGINNRYSYSVFVIFLSYVFLLYIQFLLFIFSVCYICLFDLIFYLVMYVHLY